MQHPQLLDLHALRSHSWHIQACSAQTGNGISQGFEWLIQDIAFRLYGNSANLAKPSALAEPVKNDITEAT